MEQQHYQNLKAKFGARVKELRIQKGLSTIEMSRRCSMDSGNYVKIEQGKVNPTLKTIGIICQALDVSFIELFKTISV